MNHESGESLPGLPYRFRTYELIRQQCESYGQKLWQMRSKKTGEKESPLQIISFEISDQEGEPLPPEPIELPSVHADGLKLYYAMFGLIDDPDTDPTLEKNHFILIGTELFQGADKYLLPGDTVLQGDGEDAHYQLFLAPEWEPVLIPTAGLFNEDDIITRSALNAATKHPLSDVDCERIVSHFCQLEDRLDPAY